MELNAEILREINGHLEILVDLCSFDDELRMVCLKFQLEHTAAKSEFEEDVAPDPAEHLHRGLRSMVDFASAVAVRVLHSHTMPAAASTSSRTNSPHVPGSVDDYNAALEMQWEQTGANLMHSAVQVMSLSLVVNPPLRQPLQEYLTHDREVVGYLGEALAIPREQELACFAEGYRTDHMALVANLTYENEPAARLVTEEGHLLSAILSCTRVDEDNPGAAEWAEFAIRNICFLVAEARQFIQSLKKAPAAANGNGAATSASATAAAKPSADAAAKLTSPSNLK